MKPETIFIIILGVAIIAFIVFALISYSKKKAKVITKGLEEGIFTPDDLLLTGNLKIGVRQAGKEIAKGVATAAVGAAFGIAATRSVRGKQIIMALSKERIHIFVETEGFFVNSFKNNFILTNEIIEEVIVDKILSKSFAISIYLRNNQIIKCYLKSFKNTQEISTIIEVLKNYQIKN